jgi:hypothetical protein
MRQKTLLWELSIFTVLQLLFCVNVFSLNSFIIS